MKRTVMVTHASTICEVSGHGWDRHGEVWRCAYCGAEKPRPAAVPVLLRPRRSTNLRVNTDNEGKP